MPMSFKKDLTGNQYKYLLVEGWDEDISKNKNNNYWYVQI